MNLEQQPEFLCASGVQGVGNSGFAQGYLTPRPLQPTYSLCILCCSLDNTANKIPNQIKVF